MSQPDVMLSVVNDYADVSFADVAEGFERSSVQCRVEFREADGPYASFEWLIPAGAMLIYSTAFLQKLAAGHAEALNMAVATGLKSLWAKAFGPEPTITTQIVDSNGAVRGEPFSAALKTKATMRDGREVMLLYRSDISKQDFVQATTAFLELMRTHHAAATPDPLTDALRAASDYVNEPNWTLLLHFNPAAARLEIIDYVQTSMQNRFVAVPIASKK